MPGTHYSQKNTFVLWKGAVVWYCKISTFLRSYAGCSGTWSCASFSWINLNVFCCHGVKAVFVVLEQIKSSNAHMCFLWKKQYHQFSAEDKYLLMCLTIFQVNTKRNFAFKGGLLHLISPWKVEVAYVFLAPSLSFTKRDTGQMMPGTGLCSAVFNLELERSKYHMLENTSSTYFPCKMHNKSECPDTNHSANMQTPPTAKPHRRPRCADTFTGRSIPGGDMRGVLLPGSVTQIRSPAVIQRWPMLARGHDYLWLERWTSLPTSSVQLT